MMNDSYSIMSFQVTTDTFKAEKVLMFYHLKTRRCVNTVATHINELKNIADTN